MKKDPSRYSVVDEYVLEELIREYTASTPRERIEILDVLYNAGVMPPFELALRAATDDAPLVRHWIARNGRYLDYRDSVENIETLNDPDRFNLLHMLRSDRDDFVRASLYENRYVFADLSVDEWHEMFFSASHMERLAMVRNPRTHGAVGLLEALFDPESPQLGLSLPEREQIVSALLLGRQALTEHHRHGAELPPEPWDAHLFSHLWRLISKWPAESKVRKNIYLYIGTTIKTKAGIYRQCRQATFRADILRNVDSDDSDTLELGMKDDDNLCRFLAYSKVRNPNQSRLETLLETEDIYALLGLAENENLSIYQLEEVKDRLFALGAHEQARWASETIEKMKRRSIPSEPDQLFSRQDTDPEFLVEKINALGKMVLKMQHEIGYLQELVDASRRHKI